MIWLLLPAISFLWVSQGPSDRQKAGFLSTHSQEGKGETQSSEADENQHNQHN
jgi:hypothetical protein